MDDFISRIKGAQIRAGENAVIESLRAKGFEPDKEEITFTREQIKQAVKDCNKPDGFDLTLFRKF